MRSRLLPHPLLSAMLILVWLLLVNALSVGTVAMALLIGWLVPRFTSPYWEERPRIKVGWAVVDYARVVLWDILIANFQVAWLILFRRSAELRSGWLVIALDVRQPEAITMLAGTISLTPGTVSADIAADGRSLLVHALDAGDPEGEVARIKARYEARLLRIFP